MKDETLLHDLPAVIRENQQTSRLYDVPQEFRLKIKKTNNNLYIIRNLLYNLQSNVINYITFVRNIIIPTSIENRELPIEI